AGGIEAGAITFELCRELVDEFVLLGEPQIAAAMRQYMQAEQHQIEGAAGVAIAGLLSRAESLRGKKVVAIVCGGNISQQTLDSVL
ncbi:MAG: pyridoxal-phosphate dependent enzyme, partial [Gammaproteobacteria bacterium]|nr:pyridoxal-phosphate dependent enzyme [Gammaproteobacteria bacterium]